MFSMCLFLVFNNDYIYSCSSPQNKVHQIYCAISNFISEPSLSNDENNLVRKLYNNKNINRQDIHGNTCLHAAVLHNRKTLIMKLMAAGADPNIRNCKNQTPFDFAKNTTYRHLLGKQNINRV
jgi:ankyrin repeat protein